MKTYAVIENNVITNVIVAASKDIAESVTACNCIEVTEETGIAHIGLGYADGVFEQPAVEEAPTE
jgi:alanine racemase